VLVLLKQALVTSGVAWEAQNLASKALLQCLKEAEVSRRGGFIVLWIGPGPLQSVFPQTL